MMEVCASLDVVCDELNDCAWNVGVCNSFLIKCVYVRTWGAIWLNPLALVLFTVCSAITVEGFVPVLHGCVWYVCSYVRKKALLPCLCNY